MKEIQCAVKGALLEVTFPYQKGQSLRGLPRMLVELIGAWEGINPNLSFRQCGDLGVVLKRSGVQWNGHSIVF